MWKIIIATCFYTSALSKQIKHKREKSDSQSIFTDQQKIFSSNFNITKILVPTDGKYIQSNDIPSIFFTVSDPRLDGGSCIYVLEGLTPYEILEGGRDTTADFGNDHEIYFGAKDGIYKYDHDSLSAKKYSAFRDDIIQIQKTNGSTSIYILTSDNKIYIVENNGTVKTRISAVICALEFVLDTSNNIYYIHCIDNGLHIVQSTGRVECITASVIDDFKQIKLIRPAFIMENSVPFFGDGRLYLLFSNGTSERRDLILKEKLSAISVDATLYLAAAMDGKIYEFNVMDVLLRSMVGVFDERPSEVTKIVTALLESARDGVYKESIRGID